MKKLNQHPLCFFYFNNSFSDGFHVHYSQVLNPNVLKIDQHLRTEIILVLCERDNSIYYQITRYQKCIIVNKL